MIRNSIAKNFKTFRRMSASTLAFLVLHTTDEFLRFIRKKDLPTRSRYFCLPVSSAIAKLLTASSVKDNFGLLYWLWVTCEEKLNLLVHT